MEKPPIVAISHEKDSHLEFVEQHLEHPMVVIDPTSIAKHDSELSFEFLGGKNRIIYKGEDLTDTLSVWYRKPTSPKPEDLEIHPDYKDYSLSALQKHTNQLRAELPSALWVSDYFAIQRANNKTWQYKVAHELGLRVPDTLLTNNSQAAQHFIEQHDTVIVKTLATSFAQNENGEPLAFFARKVSREDTINLSYLYLAPAVFQEAIDAEADLRVTVVGNKAFAAEIRVSDLSHDEVRDWRAGHFDGNLSIEACDDLPQEITDACIAHVRELGLQYGAIDLVVGKDGNIWFLENNPNGQWAFVEEYTGQPIGQEIAALLQHKQS